MNIRHYQDDAISKIARQLKKETQYKEVPIADVIEDLDASSDFELHLKCMAYPVCLHSHNYLLFKAS